MNVTYKEALWWYYNTLWEVALSPIDRVWPGEDTRIMTTPWMIIFTGSLFQILILLAGGITAWRSLGHGEMQSFIKRWSDNISLDIINRISLPLFLFPLAYIFDFQFKLSWLGQGEGFRWVYFFVAMAIIDFVFYWRHRLYHRYFKKLHDTHHNDQGYDVSLTLRFHPVENFFNFTILFGLFYFLGLNALEAAWMIQVFAIQAYISHCYEFKAASPWQKLLGGILITPFLHQSHHNQETRGCNFGFVFSIWDRLFKTIFLAAFVIGIQWPNLVQADQANESFAEASAPDSSADMVQGKVSRVQGPVTQNYFNRPHQPKTSGKLIFGLAAFGGCSLLFALLMFYRAGKNAAERSEGALKYFVMGALFFLLGSFSLMYSAFNSGKDQIPISMPTDYNSPVT